MTPPNDAYADLIVNMGMNHLQASIVLGDYTGALRALADIADNDGRHLDYVDRSGKTALFHAVEAGWSEGVLALLRKGANHRIAFPIGNKPPLLLALVSHDRDVIEAFLGFGLDVNERDANGDTILHRLVAEHPKNSDVIEWMVRLQVAGADLDKVRNNRGETPLYTACRCDAAAAALFLLSQGVDPDARTTGGDYPMHRAAISYDPQMVKALVAAGADIEARSAHGQQTPLHVAAHNNRKAVVAALLEAGANPTARTGKGQTPDQLCMSPLQRNTYEMIRLAQAAWRERPLRQGAKKPSSKYFQNRR